MRKILTYTLLLAATAAHAVIAKPGSGVYGDEYYHYRLDEKGQITAAASTIQRDTPRRPAVQLDNTFPSTGQVHSLVILVNFSDLKFVTPNPNEAFTKMLNEPGYSENYGTGSAHDYFVASSYGQFEPFFDVYGPVNLGNTCAYYDANVRQMVIDACDSLEHVIDWDKYDANDDGDVDNIFIYYAGFNEAEGGPSTSIWPHRSYVFSEKDGSYIKYYYNGKSGKRRWLWDYACTSELRGHSGKNMCGIGTFCHEFSHVLGLDDLYDTKNDEAYTVGEWDIMCTGSYNNSGRTPPSYSAFERFMVGWLTPTQLTEIADYTLPAITDVPSETDNRPRAYLIASTTHNMNAQNPNPKEYWLIENRQRVGWDQPNYCLPGTGLLISHITFDAKKWENNTPNNSTPLGYDIVEASGNGNNYSSAADLYPGTGRITTFTPQDNKGNKLTNNILQQIRTENGTTNIIFRHGPMGAGFNVTNNGKDTLQTEVNDKKQAVYYSVTSLEISGKQLTDRVVHIYSQRHKIALSFDSVKWTTDTLTDTISAEGTYQRQIYARYQTTQQCRTESDILQVIQQNEKLSTQYPLYGHSERAQLIGEVQTLDATDVTPYSFTAHWEEEEDAEEYALHVFSIQQNTSTQNTKVGRKLSEHGETYHQDFFPLTIRTLELNYTQHWNNADAAGVMAIDAKSDQEWVNIDSLNIRNVTKTNKKTYTFTEEQGYSQYRIRFFVTKGKPAATINSVNITSHYTAQYRNTNELPNDQTELEITGLTPSAEYYYYVTCQEEKGCQLRSTTRGPLTKVRTLPGTSNTGKQFTCLNQNGQVTAYLPQATSSKRLLLVYSTAGQLVEKVEVPEMAVSVSIPTQGLAKGQIYAVKLVTSEKLTRKQIWAKILY